MDSQIRNIPYLVIGVGLTACILGLSGCILGAEGPETDGTGISSSALIAPVAARQSQGNPAPGICRKRHPHHGCRPPVDPGGGSDTRVLLTETWDVFDGAIWGGDGDQWVADGLFSALEGAESATADWMPGEDGALGAGRVLRFSNELVSEREPSGTPPEREALFFLSGDEDASFQNYLFVSLRYSALAGTVSLASFGASGGVEFDHGVDLTWIPSSDLRLVLDVEIDANAYRILLDGEPVDEIALSRTLNRVTLFEVGVQSGPEGDLGLIDQTSVSLDTPRAPGGTGCRKGGFVHPHGRHRPAHAGHWRARAKIAKAKLEHCAHPSRGLKALARIRK